MVKFVWYLGKTFKCFTDQPLVYYPFSKREKNITKLNLHLENIVKNDQLISRHL